MAENQFIAPEAATTPKSKTSSIPVWKDRLKNEKTRRVLGWSLGVFGFYLFLSFAYHLTYAGEADQSAVQYGPLQTQIPTRNGSGSIGAWFANRFITRGFGFIAILFPLYVMLVGYAVHQKKHFLLLKKLFMLMAFVAYWVSATMTLLNRWFELGFTDLGGYVGEYICDVLGRYVGNAGLGLLSLSTLVAFLILKFNFKFRLTDFLSVPVLPDVKRPEPSDVRSESIASPSLSAQPHSPSAQPHSPPAQPHSPPAQPHSPSAQPHSPSAQPHSPPIAPLVSIESFDGRNDEIKLELIVEKAEKEPEVEPVPTDARPVSGPPNPVVVGTVDEFEPPTPLNVVPHSPSPVSGPPNPVVVGTVDEFEPPAPLNVVSHSPSPVSGTQKPVVVGTVDEFEPPAPLNVVSHSPSPASGTQKPVVVGTVDDKEEEENYHNNEAKIMRRIPSESKESETGRDERDKDKDKEQQKRFAVATPPSAQVLSIPAAVPLGKTPADLPLIIEKRENEQELKEKEFAAARSAPESDYDPKSELSRYQYPSINLLRKVEVKGNEVDPEEQERNKMRIIETLLNYGVEITQIKATVGPTITLYEIVPAPGIKISKIKNLEDDIALSLSAKGIRIIAPMPGKGTIGVEIPNAKETVVPFRSVIATQKFRDTDAILPLAVGKTISNEVFVADLAKMPHLLVAGATGQGKSVGLNSMIASLLYKKHPAEIKFVLIDPKKVELTLYKSLEKHFLAKLPGLDDAIITDTKHVVHVLTSLCMEMDNRYQQLQKARVRNIVEYNAKFTARQLNPQKGHHYMPYIVLVIDELADLMMTAGKEIELPIARLAQLARAVGIHLIVATQRPSVNVITGIIKANFPARMSYKVMSKIDSRTILDTNGAEQLIGKGDLLLFTGSELIRIQNSYIDTSEVEALVDYIASQPSFPEPYLLPEVAMGGGDETAGEGGGEIEARDPMFEEAARIVVRNRAGSTSFIQRRLSLGYARAGRIMDQLQAVGIVGPADGSKPREVLVTDERELEKYL